MRIAYSIGIATTLALVLAVQVGAQVPPGDPYLCYKAKPARAARGAPPFPIFMPRSADRVDDAFGALAPGDQHLRDLKKVLGICAPAEVDGVAVADDVTHLESYKAVRSRTVPRQPGALAGVHVMLDRFTSVRLGIRGLDRVLMRAAVAMGSGGITTPPSADVDAFTCYPAKPVRGSTAFTPRTVTVHDQLEDVTLLLSKVTRVCAPADVGGGDPGAPAHPGHLVCYRARLARTPLRQTPIAHTLVSTDGPFGPQVVTITAVDELCVPGLKDLPQPTSTPLGQPSSVGGRTATPRPPTFTPDRTPTAHATVTPTRTVHASRTPTPHSSGTPRATRTATVAPTPTETVQATPTATIPPTATVTVPPTVTVTRTPPPTVTPPPPRTATPKPTFTASGTPTRTPPPGKTATPTVTRTPSPTISPTPTRTKTPPPVKTATPTVTRSPTPTKSATPTPTRSATPTRSPTPVGTPVRLIVQPATRTVPQDASVNFTGLAEYRNGVQQNYTQKVDWSSDDETVATVSNVTGMRGRATGHTPGTALISVHDPVTGLTSSNANSATLTVIGALESLTVSPSTATRNVNETVNFAVMGHFGGGVDQNVTQDVIYSSDNLAVAIPTNQDGNRSLVEAVGVGVATISVTDPTTGITSTASGGDAVLTVDP